MIISLPTISMRTYTNSKEGNSLVDTAERGDIDGLATDSTLRANTSRVFTGTGVDNSVNEDLDRVLVGEEVDDLERVRDNANGQELLAVVATLHHQAKPRKHSSVFISFNCYNLAISAAHLSTRRSTIGICAFLNCFFA